MKLELYTTDNCQYCNVVKMILKENNVEYTEYNVSNDEVRREEMIKLTGMRKVPVVRNGDRFVVGASEEEILNLIK
jgi:glutaredoxin